MLTATTPPITTLLFTGVIVPARCIQATLDENKNPDYLYEEVRIRSLPAQTWRSAC